MAEIANGCTAAQAECLREISESGADKQTGLDWNEFFAEYIGLSRPRVDALIHNLEEFGKTCFDLATSFASRPRRTAASRPRSRTKPSRSANHLRWELLGATDVWQPSSADAA